jgi:predicted ATPase
MLEHDPLAGLSVPVELLVRERSALEGGGTDLMYNLPSSLIAGVYFWEGSGGVGKTKLMDASEALDDKLRALVEFIAQTPE